jgi:CDP-diglyceride synthetase
MIELLFLLGFSLHNIEEALWIPGWSKHAKKINREVSRNEFCFAVIIVTALGYLITFQYYLFSSTSIISKYIFLGFALMMVLNAFFPHLIASILLRKYAPGTITALLLNVPVGIYIIITAVKTVEGFISLLLSTVIVTIIFIALINFLFKIGSKIDFE